MRFASLGSGSRGNALIVDAGDTRLLIDCGFSTRTTVARLARLGVEPDGIHGVLVTHEHTDHMAGVTKFCARFGIPLYLTQGTCLAAPRGLLPTTGYEVIDSHERFSIRGLEVQPFPVPHDAREPVQFVLGDGVRCLGVLTDTGVITPHIVDMLRRCDGLVLECNHDAELLATSDYPASLKRRISGNLGHLDNQQAAALLQRIETGRLQHLIAAHLSEQNNRPELAVKAIAGALNCAEHWVGVADQEDGFAWRQLS